MNAPKSFDLFQIGSVFPSPDRFFLVPSLSAYSGCALLSFVPRGNVMSRRSIGLVDSDVIVDSKRSPAAGDSPTNGLAGRLENLRSYLENSLRWKQQVHEIDAGAELSIDLGRVVSRD
jgi:hypothetical protein